MHDMPCHVLVKGFRGLGVASYMPSHIVFWFRGLGVSSCMSCHNILWFRGHIRHVMPCHVLV